jgi:hypothetical protein
MVAAESRPGLSHKNIGSNVRAAGSIQKPTGTAVKIPLRHRNEGGQTEKVNTKEWGGWPVK